MNHQELGFIYKIVNKENNKKYIGQTINNINRRWSAHLSRSKTDCNYALYSAIRKYGTDCFKIEILEKCQIKDLDNREKYWIEKYHTFLGEGYNMTEGGDINPMLGKKHSEKTKKILSEQRKGENNPFYGHNHSDEAIEKIKKSRLGTTYSQKIKNLMSLRKIGKLNSFFGKKHTEKTKEKLHINNRGENSHRAKLTEKKVVEIKSLLESKLYTNKQIADQFGVQQACISKIKNGQRWRHV